MTLDLFDSFETDKECVDKGVWLDIEVAGRLVGRIRCRPADASLNADYRREVLQLARDVQQVVDDDGLSEEKDRELLAGVYAASVVTDWEFTRKGKAWPCNKKNIVKAFVELPKLFTIVKRKSQQWTNYRKQFEADAVKN